MDNQIWIFGKGIRPLFADQVTYMDILSLWGLSWWGNQVWAYVNDQYLTFKNGHFGQSLSELIITYCDVIVL